MCEGGEGGSRGQPISAFFLGPDCANALVQNTKSPANAASALPVLERREVGALGGEEGRGKGSGGGGAGGRDGAAHSRRHSCSAVHHVNPTRSIPCPLRSTHSRQVNAPLFAPPPSLLCTRATRARAACCRSGLLHASKTFRRWVRRSVGPGGGGGATYFSALQIVQPNNQTQRAGPVSPGDMHSQRCLNPLAGPSRLADPDPDPGPTPHPPLTQPPRPAHTWPRSSAATTSLKPSNPQTLTLEAERTKTSWLHPQPVRWPGSCAA